MRLDEIVIGDRVRKDMGDIAGLAESIKRHGLLHPVVVKADGTLVAGHRRIEAVRSLDMKEIAVTVVDVEDLLSAERDENEERKQFTPTEAVAIGRLIEDQHKVRVKATRPDVARRAGLASAAARSVHPTTTVKEDDVVAPPLGLSEQAAAKAVGMSQSSYYRAKKIVSAAESDPETFGDLPTQMDDTGNVAGTHREMERRKAQADPKREKHAPRHAIHAKTQYPKFNDMMNRATQALDGTVMGLRLVEVDKLDTEKITAWRASMETSIAYLRQFCKELTKHEE